ncbi:unnamed protein product [Rhizophagus irregularis]|nr:unnamed protein product [Rhizophagus irregularis]
MIFKKCFKLYRLSISHKLCYKKYGILNFIRLKGNLSNIVELICGQHIGERFFHILAEICVNIRKLELKDSNKNNNQGLIKLIEAQNKLEYFTYNGNEGRNWDNFCEEIGQALIKHKNTLKHIHGKTRLCIPLTILDSFVNLETLMLGYFTRTMNGLHSIKLPKLQGDLLINCSQLKHIKIYDGSLIDESLNGDAVLKILLKSTSKNLQRIEIKGSWKFSVEAIEKFLNNLKERNYSLYSQLSI